MLGKTCQEVQGPNFYHKNIPKKGIFEDIKEVRKHIQETEAISEQTGDFSAISLILALGWWLIFSKRNLKTLKINK